MFRGGYRNIPFIEGQEEYLVVEIRNASITDFLILVADWSI